jgi:glycosyltransferase involved in cell wall biosynthesis
MGKLNSCNPFFSIIIPTFNSAKTINECIESVLSQTFPDFEILLIDGASKDDTVKLTESFGDSRIKIISEPDNGIYDAMNKGIINSTGKWLYFLGSDDSLHDSDVLKFIYDEVNNTNLDVVYGNVQMLPSNKIYDGLFTYEKMQTVTLCHQAIFYKRKIFKDFGLYNINYKVLADHDMNLKWFFSKRHKSKYTDRVIAFYLETGFSSFYVDKAFENDFSKKLLWHGLTIFSILRLKELALETALIRKKNTQKFNSYFYYLLYYFFRMLDLIQRKVFIKGK